MKPKYCSDLYLTGVAGTGQNKPKIATNFPGVIDIGLEFLAGVDDTSEACLYFLKGPSPEISCLLFLSWLSKSRSRGKPLLVFKMLKSTTASHGILNL
jgi:hypothetical protein